MFEWDPDKAARNEAKHGVAFREAATIFLDPRGLDAPDEKHSIAETRRLRLAMAESGRILIVAYTIRGGVHEEVIRIISARPANQRERQSYLEETD